MRARVARYRLRHLLIAILGIGAWVGAYRYGWDTGFRDGRASVNVRGRPYPVHYTLPFLPKSPDSQHDFERFEKLIYRSVEPDSWEIHGGHGKMDYIESHQVVVVWNDRKAHFKFANLVEQLTTQDKIVK